MSLLQKIFQPSVKGRIWRAFAFILVLVIVGGLIDAGNYYNKGVDVLSQKTGGTISLPHTKEVPFRLGLDLQGGTHLVYQADMSEVEPGSESDALEGVRDVIENRVNLFGVSEPVVQTNISNNEYRLIVELAGVSDVKEAIDMIGETPLLEFKEQEAATPELTEENKKEIESINSEAEKKGEEVLGMLLSNGDFDSLAKEYNTSPQLKDNGGDLGWITEAESPEVVGIVKNLNKSDFTHDLERTSNGYTLFKLEDVRKKSNPFDENEVEKEVKAAHILICYDGSEQCSNPIPKEEAYEKIKQLKAEATTENFSELAKANSTEPGASQSGGELGWFNRSAMVKPFADTVFDQKVGTISYIVETKFGYHLIYKEDERTTDEYKVRQILFQTKSEQDYITGDYEWKNTELSGKNLKRSVVQFDPKDNSPQVALEFDDEGAKLFAEITERNVGKQVAIYLDGYAISVPTVNEPITGGRAVITGSFSVTEAKELARYLNAGALPVPITIVNQQTVGATLGKASLESSLEAGIVGLILVAIFMLLFYRLPGLIAVFSLCIYGILVLAVFKIWPVTLSLSGLAGFVLSIGMAVDANVLIFERLKEELNDNEPLDRSISNSFERAWPSIRDGNISTLITCVILYIFSTSIIKGFAVTLFLGVSISMFSAIIVTKTITQLIEGEWLEKRMWLIGVKNKK